MINEENFHYAKLALFNVRLLNDFQTRQDEQTTVGNIITERCHSDNIRQPISLLNQTVFLQMAYICLVWLWEQMKEPKEKEIILQKISNRFNFNQFITISGQRNLNTVADYFRLIRNAISHGKVKIYETVFRFEDKSPQEEYATIIETNWENVGALSEAVIFSVNDFLYFN